MLGAWGFGLGAGLGVARFTSMGPVAFRLSWNHGVHVGDLAAMGLGCLGAVAVTWWLLRPLTRHHPPS